MLAVNDKTRKMPKIFAFILKQLNVNPDQTTGDEPKQSNLVKVDHIGKISPEIFKNPDPSK